MMLALIIGLFARTPACVAEVSETISLIGEEGSENTTVTGTHFKVTAGWGNIQAGGLTVNSYGAMTIESLYGEVITRVSLSYTWDKNKDTVSASPGTMNDAHDDISDINATSVTISSSSTIGVRFGSVRIYYRGVDVTDVILDQTSASILEGDTLTLTATVSPADASDETITWSTSDSSVATVSDGVVTAVAPGTAIITATATNGKFAACTLTVRAMTCSFTFPETPFIQNPGWNPLTEGISASGDIPSSKKLVVTVSSTNGFKLVSRGGSLSYKFAETGDASTTYDNAEAKTRWEFTADELKDTGTTKPIGIVIEDYTGWLSGAYTGDAQFTGTIE